MRVYAPATLAMVEQLLAGGSWRPVSGTAFAVTPALRESYTSGDDEELSEVAMREAARASLRLLAADDPAAATADTAADGAAADGAAANGLPVRRVVVVAEVPDAKARPDLDDAVVRLPGEVSLSQVAAVHVDGADAEPAVRAAVAVIDAADLGDEDAELAVGDAEDHDLGWYATQELPFLLELL
ncbi:DUF6912 family protein [Gordonia sp. VNK21]|uniref:DUF6912 family protein n=1 Tax=Gordonia sp. VNK21 TaxID=3382483 RepID=UPI0038D3E15E